MSEKIVALNKGHLQQLIKETIEKEGPNCDLNFIDVSKVKTMLKLFIKSPFNGDISRWDVSNVKNMMGMFAGSKFDGDISNRNVSSDTRMEDMFSGCPLYRKRPKWYIDADD